MIMATSLRPHLCSTSVIEDSDNSDDVIGVKLSYTFRECFFTVVISSDLRRDDDSTHMTHEDASIIEDFISRFNHACTVTEEDKSIADVDERLDSLWHEAEEWIQAVVFEKIMSLGRRYGPSSSRGTGSGRKLCGLIEYLYPRCFNLQLVITAEGFGTVLRSDIEPCFPFAIESDIRSDFSLTRFCAQEIEVLHRPRPHVLKVRTKFGVFCCKLNNSGAQNSFLREFNTLRELDKHVPPSVRIPRLKGTIEVTGGVIGFLTDWVDTEDSDLLALLDRKKDISMSCRRNWADHVSETVRLLHSKNLIWGDAKTSNVLVDRDGNAWLIDFGGGFTQGWIDESLYDTQQGDLQGVDNTILDIFGKR